MEGTISDLRSTNSSLISKLDQLQQQIASKDDRFLPTLLFCVLNRIAFNLPLSFFLSSFFFLFPSLFSLLSSLLSFFSLSSFFLLSFFCLLFSLLFPSLLFSSLLFLNPKVVESQGRKRSTTSQTTIKHNNFLHVMESKREKKKEKEKKKKRVSKEAWERCLEGEEGLFGRRGCGG